MINIEEDKKHIVIDLCDLMFEHYQDYASYNSKTDDDYDPMIDRFDVDKLEKIFLKMNKETLNDLMLFLSIIYNDYSYID